MNIIPYEFHGKNVRIIMIDDDPWFVAIDVCRILGLINITEAVRSLLDNQKSTFRINEGGPEHIVINEKGFYRLILKSRVKTAIQVQEWLTDKVMPSIRKTGSYSAKPKSQIDLIIESAMVLKDLEQRVSNIEKIQKDAQQELLALPEPTEEIPERTVRSEIHQLVNNTVRAKNIPHSHLWNMVYTEYNYLFGTNLTRRANERDCGRLDIIEHDRGLNKFYTICVEKFKTI